ncbi:MAG: Mu-like prophage major head subunit gpT family protein, partial [Rubripirellula sp.]
VTPTRYERVRAGETVEVNGAAVTSPASGFTLVRAGVLKEVSIVAIGADGNTSVTISAAYKGLNMDETETVEATAETIRADAVAESQRIASIRRLCGTRHGDIEVRAIDEGWDAAKTELAVLRASRPRSPGYSTQRGSLADGDVLQAAILTHMGYETVAEQRIGADATQRARDMRATSLVDLCRTALQIDGRESTGGRDGMVRAALSSYSLPIALGDAANKLLFESYNEAPAAWRSFAAVKSATDFKDHVGVRPSQTGDLEELPRGGEIKHGSVDESIYKYSIDTFAKMLSIDRRDIINDDLSMFDDTARSLGRAAMRSLNDLVFKVLLAAEGTFFKAANGNYDTGPDSVLSFESLGIGVSRMLRQRDKENRNLDIQPRTLLVPPELQQTAKAILESEYLRQSADNTPTGNAMRNIVSLETEPRLSNSERFPMANAESWYLFGSTADMPMIVAFLQGKQTPTVEFFGFDSEPNKLAVTWRVYFDYGAAMADHRAAYKAKG